MTREIFASATDDHNRRRCYLWHLPPVRVEAAMPITTLLSLNPRFWWCYGRIPSYDLSTASLLRNTTIMEDFRDTDEDEKTHCV